MITVNSKGVKLKAWSNQEGTGVSGWKSARGHPSARLEYGETWGILDEGCGGWDDREVPWAQSTGYLTNSENSVINNRYVITSV